ncbi:hypothetical protein PMAYCL1PPCAC_32075, partial [Pristionchus mayeri]
MKLLCICLLLPLAAAQLPFNIFDIPPALRNPLVLTAMEVAKTDTQCFRDIKSAFNQLLLAGLTAQKCKSLECLKDEKITNATYAMKMLASTGRPHSLYMDEMSVTFAGDPKLCMNIEGPFETNYCYLHVNVDWSRIDFASYGISFDNLPGGKIPDFDFGQGHDRCSPIATTNVKMALCLPGSCEKDTDIGRILHKITNGTAHLCEINCVDTKNEPTSFFYLFNVFLIGLLLIAVTASILDYIATRKGMEAELKGRTEWRLLTSFSVLRNTSDIFSIRTSGDSIACLDAIRLITFTWVVNGHAVMFSADGDNGLQLMRETDYFFSDILLNAYPSVDTFFLVSGLLVSYVFFKRVHSNPEYVYAPMNWIILTPSYMLFIALYVAWTPQMHGIWAAGTAFNTTRFVENCENSWWMNALYLNNFQEVDQICYPISWFLCVDTQLYWAAPLFLLAIYYSCMLLTNTYLHNSSRNNVMSGVLLSIGSTVFLTAYYDLPALAFTVATTGDFNFTKLYMKPWARCIPYLVGIISGYLIVQVRKQTIKIRQPKMWELAVGWLLSTIVALTVIFSVYDYLRGQSEWSVAVRSFYGVFSRIGWSAAVAWVVFACTFNWAGPVKSLLEHPLWYPLGRLSYCAFLAHWFTLQIILSGSDRPPHFVSLLHTCLTVTVPVVFLSYAIAYFWSCLVEIPFGKIEGIAI